MTDQHPISPPPELVQQWGREFLYGPPTEPAESHAYIATCAAQWGYDQRGEVNEAKLQQARDEELEAIIRLAGEAALPEKDRYFDGLTVAAIRAARRPKSPGLREEALAKTTALLDDPGRALLIEVREILELNRRALEALPE